MRKARMTVLLEIVSTLLFWSIPVTVIVGLPLLSIWMTYPDPTMSGLEFFWACVVVGSLSVLEARMFGIVTVVLEARLGCAENRGVVAWGHDGFRPREGLPDEGILVGKVVAHEALLEGPDGRPCVAALRVLEEFRHQNRWCAFVVETPRQHVLVNVFQEGLCEIESRSWRIEARRPRWFWGAAFASHVAPGEGLDWIVVRPGDTVRIEAGFCGDVRLSSERPLVPGDDAAEGGKPTQSPYRPLGAIAEVNLRKRDGGDGGGSAPILVEVVSASTTHWNRRARVQANLIGIAGVLGVDMLVLGATGPEDLFSAVPRFVVLLGGAVLLVLRIGKLVADGAWWALPPQSEVVETHVRARRSRAYFVLLLAAAPWPIAWAAATSDFGTLAVVVGALALLLFVGLAFAPTPPAAPPYEPLSIAPRSGSTAASAAPASGAVSADDAADADGHERPQDPTP
jgi:hypothetical protein